MEVTLLSCVFSDWLLLVLAVARKLLIPWTQWTREVSVTPPGNHRSLGKKYALTDWLAWLLAAKYMVLHQKPPSDCMDHSTLPQSHIEHHSLTSLIYCAVASLPVSFEGERPEKSKRNRTT